MCDTLTNCYLLAIICHQTFPPAAMQFPQSTIEALLFSMDWHFVASLTDVDPSLQNESAGCNETQVSLLPPRIAGFDRQVASLEVHPTTSPGCSLMAAWSQTSQQLSKTCPSSQITSQSLPRFWSGCSRFTNLRKTCRLALEEAPASANSRCTFSKISRAALPGGASWSQLWQLWHRGLAQPWRRPSCHSWCGYEIRKHIKTVQKDTKGNARKGKFSTWCSYLQNKPSNTKVTKVYKSNRTKITDKFSLWNHFAENIIRCQD